MRLQLLTPRVILKELDPVFLALPLTTLLAVDTRFGTGEIFGAIRACIAVTFKLKLAEKCINTYERGLACVEDVDSTRVF